MKCCLMLLWYSRSHIPIFIRSLFYSGGGRLGGRDPSDELCGAVNFLHPTSNTVLGETFSTKIVGDVASP